MRTDILAISSGGGHWVQLLRLKPAFDSHKVVFASVYEAYAADVPGCKFYAFNDASRFSKANYLVVIVQLLRIVLRERPRVVITTGSSPGLFALALAKILLRSKTIWIDSIANCEQVSSSGERARWIADVWLTQWEHLSNVEGPRYLGAVI